MSKVSITKFELAKFDGRMNFELWQKRMKAVLVQQGLHKALLGKEENTKKMTDEEWDELDLKALTLIQLYLTDEVMYSVLDEETTIGLWRKLEKLYTTNSLTNKLYLKRQLYSLRMVEGSCLLEHLNTFDRLVAQLLSLDVKINEEDKAVLLLSSLPESYDLLVMTIMYGKETLEMDEVTSILLLNETRQKPSSSDGESLAIKDADHVRSWSKEREAEKNMGMSNSKLKKSYCKWCKKDGHWMKDCKIFAEFAAAQSKRVKEPNEASVAFDTPRDGHISMVCSGELKKVLSQETGLEPQEQRLLFRGKEKDNEECLHMAGVKDMSKVILLEDPASKERKLEQMKGDEGVSKACEAVAVVRSEVDKLAGKVTALMSAVQGGIKIVDKEFVMLTELLMVQLLKLDSIKAEGEAKVQRRTEVRRIQSFVDTLDTLKARNSNPFSSSSNAVPATTQWQTFESGMGSLSAPPPIPSSTKVTKDWERFD